jgi:MFS family permease
MKLKYLRNILFYNGGIIIMENQVYQKTSFGRLLFASLIGLGTSLACMVLLNFGIIQFAIIKLVGPENVTAVFGTVSGIVGLAIVVLTPLGGVIADRTKFKIGRRRFWIIAGSIGGGASMIMLAYAPSILVLTVAFCLLQFFYGMVTLSCYAIVPEQVEPEKFGRISGLMGAAGPIFVMSGQIVLGIFADISVPEKIIGMAAIQIVCGITCALLIKDNQFLGERSSEKKKGFSNGFKNFYPSFKKYPEYTWALLTKLFIYMTNAGLTLLTLFYIARFHLGEADIFKLNAYMAPSIMLMVVAGILGGFLSDKIKKQKPFVMLAALVTGVCMIVFAFSGNVTLVVIGNFVFNFGFGMYGAVDNAIVNRILPSKKDAGKDLGIMTVTSNLSTAIVNFVAPLFIAMGVKLFGGDGYTFYFLILAGFSLLSALAVIPIPEIGQEKGDKNKNEEKSDVVAE